MSNNKNMNNANVNENKNAVPETTPAAEDKNGKIRLKDRIRAFGEKHPKVAKAGKYAVAVGAGALIAIGGKSVLEAFGGHPGAGDDYYDSGDPTSAPEEPATKKEEAE